MLDRLRTLKPAATRSVLTGAFALSAIAVPGSTAQAAPAPPPAPSQVVAGTVLRPAPVKYLLPVRGYRLTGQFGDSSYHWRSTHTGLDFAVAGGTRIRSIATGRVVASGYDGSYGNKTVVRLRDGTDVWYCHQEAIQVAVGNRVGVGDVIGTVGSTGNVTGPHLHLEIRRGPDDPVDPFGWLARHGLNP